MRFTAFLGAAIAVVIILPLVWKWGLGMRRVKFALVVIALLGAVGAIVADAVVGVSPIVRGLIAAVLTLLAAFAVLAYRFYRDPDRDPPPGDDLVLSPADGEVVYVKQSREGRLPVSSKHGNEVALEELTKTKVHEGEAVVVGIGMSFLDVHVNRAPIAGQILLRRHFSGRFASLRHPETVYKNERATTVIAGRRLDVAVVQIASRLVRQIATYVREGDEVSLGQRIGVIRFGSQVDVVLPHRPDLQVLVRKHDRVEAGRSVIAALVAVPSDAGDSSRSRLAGALEDGESAAPVEIS